MEADRSRSETFDPALNSGAGVIHINRGLSVGKFLTVVGGIIVICLCVAYSNPAVKPVLRCDSPDVAAKLIPELFAKNREAQERGIVVNGVVVSGVSDDWCLVEIQTNIGLLVEEFRYDNDSGDATMRITARETGNFEKGN
jgi:hypothetical protein